MELVDELSRVLGAGEPQHSASRSKAGATLQQ
jgi:hypothetical protein